MTKDNCVETNFIIVISGVNLGEYEYIKEDLQAQLKGKSPSPLFVNLPGDYPEIEIVWINGEVEGENFPKALSHFNDLNFHAANPGCNFTSVKSALPEIGRLCLVIGSTHSGVALAKYDGDGWNVTPFYDVNYSTISGIVKWMYCPVN